MPKVFNFGNMRVRYEDADHDFQITLNQKPFPACIHKSIELNESGQTVTCADCGRELTAWWALLALVRRYAQAHAHLMELKATAEQALHQLEQAREPQASREGMRPRLLERESETSGSER